MKKHVKKHSFHYRPIILGILSVLTIFAIEIGAGYHGYGPLNAFFVPPSVNLLVEDTGEYILYQTPRQAESKALKGFAINKKTGKRTVVKNLATLTLKDKSDIPKTKVDPVSKPDEYNRVVKKVSAVINSCRNEGRGVGDDLKTCLCETLDCKNNPLVANFAKNASQHAPRVAQYECVDYLQILAGFSQDTLFAACPVNQANLLTPEYCAKQAKSLGNPLTSYACDIGQVVQNGFAKGDYIVEPAGKITKTGHISLCVDPQADGSCKVCESNYGNNGQVNCERLVKPDKNKLVAVWRNHRDENSRCYIPN